MKKKIQRPPAEIVYAKQLKQLSTIDQDPVPPGWKLSPLAVEKFILGDESLEIERKFVAPKGLVTRVIVTLATNRGAMLIGKPGTAKSLLSELLSTAISGSSELTIQGGTITNINQLLYSWNEALLKATGPCLDALIPSPLYQGMAEGKLVRFEEIARCSPKIQDGLLSLMSERQITIPELTGKDAILYAREGFNIIASSNTIDEGVYKMSAALKRRMNFETIIPIQNLNDEMDVIHRESEKLLKSSGVDLKIPFQTIEALATIFHELRNGQTLNGRSTDRLASAVMSTAEAVTVAHALGVHAYYYCDGKIKSSDLMYFIIGAAIKDNKDDRRRMRHYFETEVSQKEGHDWKEIFNQRHLL